MSGRAPAKKSAQRWRTVWRQHERGTPVRAIARDLGVAQKTVQYYLAKGRPDGLRDGPSDGQRGRSKPLTDAEAEAILADTLGAAGAAPCPVIPLRRTS